ncbi:SAM-dependent methyltransferase [Arcanobacterium wilhelmae]|uniref:SAM-dependent methyltransferase n=1 Tax=Arcanobacterium wilhelmae TaxID=1803177 RepID=A0ABT9NCJ3_9ACTO|nr:class I SAM-dependent methyltransferase [Arcanobacterium wilhelmae]MDP9801427.1 SAM-dependent methyltransferase [Arcanobacterium wilhelmae]WFN90762.1 class I SAM-dependent methyltransferase [Arcanobacterium wilhelmae]
MISSLLTPDGMALLDRLSSYDPQQVFALTAQLRAEGYSPEVVAAALTQARLREAAVAKFGPFAPTMLFTADGLEQSTRLRVSAHHASRLRSAGATSVLDVGCGIGGDSLAFAGLGLDVTAIEISDDAAAAASFNLAQFPTAKVFHTDAFSLDLGSFGADAAWLDPARRAGGRRITNPAEWSPSLETAIEIARGFRSAGIKVAPGIDYRDLPADSRVTWISDGGELLEAVIWLGEAAQTPGREALVLGDGTWQWDPQVDSPQAEAEMAQPRELGEWLYEPDPAIIRSGSVASLAAYLELAPVSQAIAYLSGGEVDSPLLARFRVLDVLPFDAKAIRRELAERGIGRVEIKKRGTDVVPDTFRKKLKLDPKRTGSATLILTPLLGKHQAILAERA